MPTLKTYTASDALSWMEELRARFGERMLFRGQNRTWPTIRPSITRDDAATQHNMWEICRLFCGAAMGITGYSVPKGHHRLGILQHYMLRSPVIDLTGTPKIALYFAMTGGTRECVVYSVDRDKACVPGVVFSDHSFLILPAQQGGFAHRWLKQDGYTVGPADWSDQKAVRDFDLLKLNGVERMSFRKQHGDEKLVQHLGDLESIGDDPLAWRVRSIVKNLAETFDLVSPKIQEILEASKTGDPDVVIEARLDRLVKVASRVPALGAIIRKLQMDFKSGYWDTSYAVALDWVEQQLTLSDTSVDKNS